MASELRASLHVVPTTCHGYIYEFKISPELIVTALVSALIESFVAPYMILRLALSALAFLILGWALLGFVPRQHGREAGRTSFVSMRMSLCVCVCMCASARQMQQVCTVVKDLSNRLYMPSECVRSHYEVKLA